MNTQHKFNKYEEWKEKNHIHGTLEEANAFYSGYSEGYVKACEDNQEWIQSEIDRLLEIKLKDLYAR